MTDQIVDAPCATAATVPPMWRVALWVTSIALCACAYQACVAAGIAVSSLPLAALLAAIGMLALLAVLCERGGRYPRLQMPLEGAALLWLQSATLLLFEYPYAMTRAPLRDEDLASLDRLLRFDWNAHFHFVISHPLLLDVLTKAYFSFGLQTILLVVVIGFLRPARIAKLLAANLVAILITIFVYALVPSEGAGAFYRPDADWNYIGPYLAARAGQIHQLDMRSLNGLIAMPSYHAAMAVFLAYGFWALPRIVSVPIALIEAVMIYSALSVGAHYLVDLLAGMLVAVVSLAIASWTLKRLESRYYLALFEHNRAGLFKVIFRNKTIR